MPRITVSAISERTVHEMMRKIVRRGGRRRCRAALGAAAGAVSGAVSGSGGGVSIGGSLIVGGAGSLRDDRQIAAAACSIAAVGVKDRALATRAEPGVGNAVVAEAALAQDVDRVLREIDVRL